MCDFEVESPSKEKTGMLQHATTESEGEANRNYFNKKLVDGNDSDSLHLKGDSNQ